MVRFSRLFESPIPVHLLIGPLAPVLLLIAVGRQLAPPMPTVWLVAGLWGAIVAVLAGLTWFTRNVRISAGVIAVLLVAFFVDLSTTALSRLLPLVSIGIWVGAATCCVVLIRRKDEARGLTVFANLLFVFVSLLSCGQLAASRLSATTTVKPDRLDVSVPATVLRAHIRPDIYLFVLDGYARADVVKRLYGYDDRLVRRLTQDGFYVADRASSNYAQTALSLSSSLNLDYLPALIDGVPGDTDSRVPCRALLADNRTFRILRRAGYRVAAFASEYSLLTFPGVDEEYAPPFYLTDFSGTFFNATVPAFSRLVGLPPSWIPHQIRRRHIQWTLEQLSRGLPALGDTPRFVFVHIMLPHPPFVFEPDGEYTWTRAHPGIYDGDHWRAQNASRESYEGGYRANLQFLDDRLGPVVERILARATRPTTVIIQGDHGSGSRLVWDNPAASDMNERLGILLAVKFGGSTAARPYPTLTPLNAMRMALNDAVGANLPLLEDRAWFSTWSHPFRFIDVTSHVRVSR